MIASDENLLAQVAAGDVVAFGEFYESYSARVLGLLIKMLGRADDAEDVLQEAFWQVWSTAHAYDPARIAGRVAVYDCPLACLRRTAARATAIERAPLRRTARRRRCVAFARTRRTS